MKSIWDKSNATVILHPFSLELTFLLPIPTIFVPTLSYMLVYAFFFMLGFALLTAMFEGRSDWRTQGISPETRDLHQHHVLATELPFFRYHYDPGKTQSFRFSNDHPNIRRWKSARARSLFWSKHWMWKEGLIWKVPFTTRSQLVTFSIFQLEKWSFLSQKGHSKVLYDTFCFNRSFLKIIVLDDWGTHLYFRIQPAIESLSDKWSSCTPFMTQLICLTHRNSPA